MSDGMERELAYMSSHATNRYFIPNWGIVYDCKKAKYDDYVEAFKKIGYEIKKK